MKEFDKRKHFFDKYCVYVGPPNIYIFKKGCDKKAKLFDICFCPNGGFVFIEKSDGVYYVRNGEYSELFTRFLNNRRNNKC